MMRGIWGKGRGTLERGVDEACISGTFPRALVDSKDFGWSVFCLGMFQSSGAVR